MALLQITLNRTSLHVEVDMSGCISVKGITCVGSKAAECELASMRALLEVVREVAAPHIMPVLILRTTAGFTLSLELAAKVANARWLARAKVLGAGRSVEIFSENTDQNITACRYYHARLHTWQGNHLC